MIASNTTETKLSIKYQHLNKEACLTPTSSSVGQKPQFAPGGHISNQVGCKHVKIE